MRQGTTQSAGPRDPDELSTDSPLIEIGWIVVGRLDETDLHACQLARETVRATLERMFPEFHWRLPIEFREDLTPGIRIEPVVLLDDAVAERDAKGWDYAFMITGADLVSHYKPFALAALSRSREVAVISTTRIDPHVTRSTASEEERVQQIARRLEVLAIHGLGHLNGLGHDEHVESYMYDVNAVEDLDRMHELSGPQRVTFATGLRQAADLRLEEQPGFRRKPAWTFYLNSAWCNRGDIWESVREARPWQFPLRLSRLTTAALSAMLVLLMTAEVWELGMSLSGGTVTFLSFLVLFATTIYVILRQQLLLQRGPYQLSEQRVVKNLATFLVVFLGMTTTYVVLFGLTVSSAWLLFGRSLVRNWAATVDSPIDADEYLTLSALIASVGLFIGALGASFENQQYFRHVTYVDEET